MKWPWISRRRHMEEIVAHGAAYRAEIEEANRRAAKAERNLREWAYTVARPLEPYQEYHRDVLVIPIEVTNTLRARYAPSEMLSFLGQEVTRRLFELNRKHFPVRSGDLREVGHV